MPWNLYISGGFRGGSGAVTHGHVSELLNFDRSTVKRGTQNIQNDCRQWLSDSFRVHQFRPGLRPQPHWGSLQRSPDTLAGLGGT